MWIEDDWDIDSKCFNQTLPYKYQNESKYYREQFGWGKRRRITTINTLDDFSDLKRAIETVEYDSLLRLNEDSSLVELSLFKNW